MAQPYVLTPRMDFDGARMLMEACNWQPTYDVKRAIENGEGDPYEGENPERDALTQAFLELNELDMEVRQRAAQIFAKHGIDFVVAGVHVAQSK